MTPSAPSQNLKSSRNFTFASGSDGEVSLPPTTELRICIFFGADRLALSLQHPDGKQEEMILPPRTMMVVDRKVAASLAWRGAADVLVVGLNRNVLAEASRNLGVPKSLRPGMARMTDPVLQNISGMVRDLFLRDGEVPASVAASATQLLAVRLLTQIGRSARESRRERLSPAALRRTLEFIDSHLMEDFGLEEMARAAGCSRFHFARAFRSSTGVSPWRYVTGRRLKQAEELLRTQEQLSVADVCHMVGFQDQSHFTRAFKNVFSVTPGHFRRRAIGRAA